MKCLCKLFAHFSSELAVLSIIDFEEFSVWYKCYYFDEYMYWESDYPVCGLFFIFHMFDK